MPQQLTSQLRSIVTVTGSSESRCISSTMSRPSVTEGTKRPRIGPPGSVAAQGTWGVTTSVEKGMSWRTAGFASPRRRAVAATASESAASPVIPRSGVRDGRRGTREHGGSLGTGQA